MADQAQSSAPADPGAQAASSASQPDQTGQMYYTAQDPSSGTTIDGTENDIADHLRSKGYNVGSISPDGTQFTQPWAPPMAPASPAAMQRGYTTHNFADTLAHIGLQNVTAQPRDTDQTSIEPSLSAETNQLKTDAAKKDFIQQKLQSRGMDNPKVVGSGTDWHAFVPETGKWAQITEKPNFHDLSGYEDLAYKAPETILSGMGAQAGGGLGGALGLESGPGALATSAGGAILGAGAGSALGQEAQRGGLSFADPAYAHALGAGGSEEEQAEAMHSLYNAATGPFVAAAGKIPIEGIANAVGSGMKRLGGLASRVGGFATKPAVAESAANLMDPTGLMQAGELMAAPSTLAGVAAKTPGYIASKLPEALPFGTEEGTSALKAGLTGTTSDLLKYGQSAEGIGRAYAERSAGKGIAEANQRAVEQGLAPSSLMSDSEQSAREAASQVADHMGLGAEESQALQDEVAKPFASVPFINAPKLAQQSMAEEVPWQQEAGRAADELAQAGNIITGAGRKAVQGAGYGLQGAGALAKGAGALTQLGGTVASKYGVPESADLVRDWLLKKYSGKSNKPMLMSP